MAPVPTARFHGRNGRLMVGVTGSAEASPVAFVSSFTLDMAADQAEVTAWGDSNKVRLLGLPDAKGSFNGFADIAGDVLYTAGRDGLTRKTYFYPDFQNAPGTYFFTTALWDWSMNTAVSAGAAVSGNWVAASDVIRVLQT